MFKGALQEKNIYSVYSVGPRGAGNDTGTYTQERKTLCHALPH